MSQAAPISWLRFLIWAVAGSVLTAGVVGAFGALVLLLPVGLVGVILLGRGRRPWPEVLGVGFGWGLLALAVSYSNRTYQRCPPATSSGTTSPGDRTITCTGTNPRVWLAVGIACTAGSVAAFLVMRAQARGRRSVAIRP